MTTIEKFGAMAENFSCVADFLLIYTYEAHPKENEDFKNDIKINLHQKLEDRISAAKLMMENESEHFRNVKVVVDSMDNHGCNQYATFPERAFIIQNGIVTYVGGVGPFLLIDSLQKVEKYLQNLHNDQVQNMQ